MATIRKGVALVTGAGQGIGRAIALRLARDGFDVALNDLQANKAKLAALATDIAEEHGGERRTVNVLADVSVEDEVKTMVGSVVQKLGGLDVMVANAGVMRIAPLVETTASDIDTVLAVNVRGTFLCYKYAAQHMISQRQGRIIGASSLAGKVGYPYLTTYTASKFAVRGLTQTAARELGPYGITVNAYAPGIIQTAMVAELNDANVKWTDDAGGFYKMMRDQAALGKLGQVEDVSGLVSYLASKEGHFITGQSISLDGGIYFD